MEFVDNKGVKMNRNTTKIIKNIFAFIITIFILFLSFFTFKTVNASEKKITINASEINKMINNPSLCPSYISIEKDNNGVSVTTKESYGNEIEINMDQELSLYSLSIRYSPLSIIGNKKLTLMIYMAADNDLESYALSNLKAIEKASFNNS